MLFVLGILIMAIGVAVSIALHEIGHLVPAKKFGVKVTQYMVGFGPTIWSRKKGETEYGIKAIPLGGYIRMIGMLPPRPGDKDGELRNLSTGRFSQMIDQARDDAMVEVTPEDKDRVFYKLPPWKKIVVMLGGPVMNLLIAIVLITIVITTFGLPESRPGAEVQSVSKCVVKAGSEQAQNAQSCDGLPASPGAAGGILPMDKILSINGQAISSPDDVGDLIRPRVDQPTTLVVDRKGEQKTLTVTPIRNDIFQYDDEGKQILDAAGKPVVIQGGFLGITTSQPQVVVRQPISAAPPLVWDSLAKTAGIITKIPEKMVGVFQAAFGGGERDPNGPISVVGVGRIGGEVAAMDVPDEKGGNWAKLAQLLMLLASLNLALFVFNLIPLMPLDGGQIAGAVWESIKKGWAKLRNRPDPGHVDVAKALPIAYAMSIVLITMSILLIYADIVSPIKLFG